jgi:hypothetical protein
MKNCKALEATLFVCCGGVVLLKHKQGNTLRWRGWNGGYAKTLASTPRDGEVLDLTVSKYARRCTRRLWSCRKLQTYPIEAQPQTQIQFFAGVYHVVFEEELVNRVWSADVIVLMASEKRFRRSWRAKLAGDRQILC